MRLWLFVVPLLLCIMLLLGAPCWAENVAEAWRSPFGESRSVSVNSTDGSCWAATRSSLHPQSGMRFVINSRASHLSWSIALTHTWQRMTPL
jgi:hypothetical protein